MTSESAQHLPPPPWQVYCERCGAALDGHKAVWLELNMYTGLYSDPDSSKIPAEESQGVFSFGTDCAKVVLHENGAVIEEVEAHGQAESLRLEFQAEREWNAQNEARL